MRIEEQELRSIEAPEPTRTWNPIPHAQVLDAVNEQLKTIGLETVDLKIDTNKSGSKAFITHQLDTGDGERNLELGWRNSLDKSLSLGFTSGTTVLVCSNMVFSGSWMEFRKHDGLLSLDDVREMAGRGTNEMFRRGQSLAAWHDQMKSLERSPRDADHLFMQLLRLGVVSGPKMGDLVNSYDEERKNYGDTLYTVYNAATRTFRPYSLSAVDEKSRELNKAAKADMVAHPVYQDPEVVQEIAGDS